MKNKSGINAILLIAAICLLAGCPGAGDRLIPNETATVSKAGEDICFQVSDARNYHASLIAINPRGTPAQTLSVTDAPDLPLRDGKLCIPPGFYRFPDQGQYIVQYILTRPGERETPRSVVAGIEFTDGQVKSIPLTDRETTR